MWGLDDINNIKCLLTVQTLGTDGLRGAAFLHHSLSGWTLLAALPAGGELAGLTGELHGPLRLRRQR